MSIKQTRLRMESERKDDSVRRHSQHRNKPKRTHSKAQSDHESGNQSQSNAHSIWASVSSETNIPETNSEIFYISNAVDQQANQESYLGQYKKSRFRKKAKLSIQQPSQLESEIELCPVSSASTLQLEEPVNYSRHSNLDVRALSFTENVHLARIHYLTFANGIRLALVIFCLVWFIYNAVTIFREYTEYNTIVYMEYRAPVATQPPAISICTYCLLCTKNSKLLETVGVLDAFKISELQKLEFTGNVGDSFEEMSDISIKCSYTSTTIPGLSNERVYANCSDAVPVVVSLQEGRKCFTFFSDIQGQMSRANASNGGRYEMKFDRFPSIRLTVSGKLLTEPPPESAWLEDDMSSDVSEKLSKVTSGLYLTLHDPTQLSSMHDIPMHHIQPGKKIDVRFEKKIEMLKEPPYATNCFPYPWDNSIRPNESDPKAISSKYFITNAGLSIYRSRGECFLYCIWRTLNQNQCVNIYSILLSDIVQPAEWFTVIHSLNLLAENITSTAAKVLNKNGKIRFCERNNRTLSVYLTWKQHCIDQCRQACRVDTFTIDPNIFDNRGQNPNKTVITVQWAPEPYTYISHHVKLELNEFLGTLGGHAHIWLGISVIHVIRYLINLVKTGEFLPGASCCCMIHWWKSMLPFRKRRH